VFFDRPISPEASWVVLPPVIGTQVKTNSSWILAIDGTWLRRQGVLMIYRDITNHENLFWSYWSSESYLALSSDLKVLINLLENNLPSGAVSDWKGSIRSGVARYAGEAPHQRCLTHVDRETKRLLPKRSSFQAVLALRNIAKQLLHIKTKEEARNWKAELIAWEKAFGLLLKERSFSPTELTRTGPKWWYTHGCLRRAWRLLTDDWYPFFVFLDHPLIPNTNNSLEAVNGQMKLKLGNHRGMKTSQQVSFLFWYLTFTRTKTKQDLKKLWDYWKT
jgi:hypothetical protein